MDTSTLNAPSSLLANGTILNGHYKIDHHFATWPHIHIYIATDTKFREQVFVKELFVDGLSERGEDGQSIVVRPGNESIFQEYKSNFNEEARTLRQIDNSHILKVTDLFESNETSYYVMEYVEGELLSDKMLRHNKPLSESATISHLTQLLDALKAMHSQSFWHLDITPSNILVDNNGICKFIEYGHYKLVDDESTLVGNPSHLDPQELEHRDFPNIGPWTDFYTLGSTLYNLLTGKRPPLSTELNEATSHLYSFPTTVSKKMQRLVLWMMTPNIFRRPQDVGEVNEFLYGLNSTNEADKRFQKTLSAATAPPIGVNFPKQSEDDDDDDDGFGSKTLKGMQIFIFAIALALLGYLAYTLFIKEGSKSDDETNELNLVKEESGSTSNVDTMSRASADVLSIGNEEVEKNDVKKEEEEKKEAASVQAKNSESTNNDVSSKPDSIKTNVTPSSQESTPTPTPSTTISTPPSDNVQGNTASVKKEEVVSKPESKKEESKPSSDSPNKRYKVIAGSFSSKDNANGLIEKLKVDGFSGYLDYSSDKGLYRVIVKSTTDHSEATSYRDKLKSKYPDVWIE